MAEPTAVAKRRSALKGQMTNLRSLVDRGGLSVTNIRMRVQRLTALFHQYEELHIELEETEENALILADIQNTFFELVSTIMETPAIDASRENPDVSNLQSGFTNSTTIERQKAVKLPVSELPKFDGSYDNWITFKNSFKSMIDMRTDIDDLNKFIYLRNSLTGAAAKKLSLFDASLENYKRGWDLLTSLYEKKRLLISNHYSAFFDNGYCKITPPSIVSPEAIAKLLDDAQQHKGALESLGVVPDEGMMISFIEKALPSEVMQEWDRTLSSDSMPSFEQFYLFIHEHVTRLLKRNRDLARPQSGNSNKRIGDRQAQSSKFRKSDTGSRAFVTNTSAACVYCKQNHPIYRCPAFDNLNLQQRWDAVKAKSLCRNCLGEHKGACKSSHCKRCDKYHHTLLHNDSAGVNKAAARTQTEGDAA